MVSASEGDLPRVTRSHTMRPLALIAATLGLLGFMGCVATTTETANTTTPAVDTSIEFACRAALIQKEQSNYATFQINNAVTEADGTVRLYYVVGYTAGNEERQLADCTGTPDAVQLRLTTVEAKEAAAAF
jgi:hypothetical protein